MAALSLVPILVACCGLESPAPVPEMKRLGLQEAITIALENNLQVEIARQARLQTQAGVPAAQGAFDANLSASLQASRTEQASGAPLYPGYPALPYSIVNLNRGGAGGGPALDVNELLPWGATADLNVSPAFAYFRSTLLDPSGNPIPGTANTVPSPYSGTLQATYTQNLLQGAGREVTLAPLVIARKNAAAADYTFQLALINLVASTEGSYWSLVYAQRLLDSRKLELELAEKHLAENKLRLKAGAIARLDLLGTEAQVAQAEQDIVGAEAQLGNARDALARALYPATDRPVPLEATEAPDLAHIRLTEEEAVRMALDRRVELKSARAARDVSQLQARVAQDKVRPSLTLSGTYVGTSNAWGSLGPVGRDLLEAKYPGYALTAKYAQPLENRAAKGNFAQARANARGSELSLRDQELGVILQARTACRNVEAAEKGVKAAEKTRYFMEKTWEAEKKKFSRGASTNFVVLQDLTNLDNARAAEVQAQITYANAVTALEQAVGNLLEARRLKVE